MKKITKTKYLQLEGLRIISKRLNKQLEEVVLAVAEITGEQLDDTNYGHASDFVYQSDETVKTHLSKLGLYFYEPSN